MQGDQEWNCDWEYENQDTLKAWYEEQFFSGDPDGSVRRIICKGCGRVFYTQIPTKKYCYYYRCGNRGYQKELKQRRLENRHDLQGLRQDLHAEADRRCLLQQRLSPEGLPAACYG